MRSERTRLGAYTLDRFTRVDYASKPQAIVLGTVFLAMAALMASGLAEYVSEIVKASEAQTWPALIVMSVVLVGCILFVVAAVNQAKPNNSSS
jgi:TRAP-type C4-dicarboxylate transport system permease small subunit